MIQFQAIINTPGYVSEQDEIPTFDTAQQAWAYLAEERESAEEDTYLSDEIGDDEYSDTVRQLRQAAGFGIAAAEMTYPDGTGCICGETPGGRMYDIGVAYSVAIVSQ